MKRAKRRQKAEEEHAVERRSRNVARRLRKWRSYTCVAAKAKGTVEREAVPFVVLGALASAIRRLACLEAAPGFL